ncbi:diacylglycerol kinase family lipid kinase [soil metagenome]
MKWMAIVNSRSFAETHLDQDRMREALGTFTEEVHFTRYPGHAIELAQKAHPATYGGIVSVGGDGTVHEILRHLHLQTQRLLVVAAGTGNSLAQELGISPAPALGGPDQADGFFAVDLMHVTCHTADGTRFSVYSASTVAVGYPALATRLANRYFKRLKGHCYSVASVLSLFTRAKTAFLVRYDGEEEEEKKVYGIMISNIRYMGNFLCFPKANPYDGQADAVELVAPIFSQLLHNLSVVSKRYFYDPSRTRLARTVHIRLPEPGLLMVDGEVYANVKAVEVEVQPRVLRVKSESLLSILHQGRKAPPRPAASHPT